MKKAPPDLKKHLRLVVRLGSEKAARLAAQAAEEQALQDFLADPPDQMRIVPMDGSPPAIFRVPPKRRILKRGRR